MANRGNGRRISGRYSVATVLCTSAIVGALGVGAAVAVDAEGADWAYAGAGSEYGEWSASQQRVRLITAPNAGMNTDRCIDSMLDWGASNSHYDSRVVRSCRPGTQESTDPGGNQYWAEPANWEGASVSGVQKGYGYVMDDDYVGGFYIYESEQFATAGSTGWSTYQPPRTGIDGYSRVRTRYEDGTVGSCNPLPARDGEFHGCS